MINLDKTEEIEKLDKQNMRSSIEKVGDQVKESFLKSREQIFNERYRLAKNIVFAAMGGSALGADFTRKIVDINSPFEIVHDYKLPSYVGPDSLVIIASYSGTTEETLSSFNEALERKAQIVAVAAGGVLIDQAKDHSLPFFQFDKSLNPSGQPRMGSGFTIGSLLGILSRLEFVNISEQEIERATAVITEANRRFGTNTAMSENSAKQVADALLGKIPVLLAAEFLGGNAHIAANQLNENAKVFADYFLLPEANHHLLEGIVFPKKLDGVKFLTLESPLYSEKIQSRFKITRELLEKQTIPFTFFETKGKSKLEDGFEALVFSSWVSFYLAMLEGIDPSPIPNVDFFKAKLSEQ